MKKLALSMMLLCCSCFVFAQDYFPENGGVKASNTTYTAFTNATIYVSPTQIIKRGTLLINKGLVVQVGKSVTIPSNTVVVDLSGKTIYPSFIDVFSNFGVKKPKRPSGGGRSAQYGPSREGFYWNDHVMPEKNAIDHFKYDSKKAEELRKAGFGVVNTHIQDGIIRGSGVLVALAPNGSNTERILDNKSAQYLSLNKSVTSRQSYPSSSMGAMALLRQMYLDADWYAKGHSERKDRSLEALNANKNLSQIIVGGSKANDLRVDKVGDEFGIQYTILGGGDEYEFIDEIKATNATYIIPLDFPKAYNVENPFLANSLELGDMREWNQKPFNPKILAENGVAFALTTHKLKKASELKTNLLKAIARGLDKTTALKTLTTVPAKILGKSETLGILKQGAHANFLISSGDIFEKETTLYENWVRGQKSIINAMTVKDIRGDYKLNLNGIDYSITLKGELTKLKAEVKSNGNVLGSKISYKEGWINLSFTNNNTEEKEFIRLVAKITSSPNLSGKAIFPNGNETSFTAVKADAKKASDKKDKKKKDAKVEKMLPLTYPNGAYGFKERPKQETLLFKNATVWTNEAQGILEQTDVLIKDGKISAIGKNLNARGAKVIDATGKHLTSGIIDEHSHIAAAAINEGGQNSSAEVSIEDVINPEDINIYRNLAGGVTSVQILHGSANPIGGRSAIIKLKWGESANNMLFKNAPKFIKFALGENVKQSNWTSFSRFPQTRMGVEQLYTDYFTRAKEYDAKKKSGKLFRKDIEMDVLAEILNKERFISSHSYVQSEINMLMKVAEKFNFRINTFTHILEGYKVADQMKAHGVGASTFSDWWAYKYEVKDAIPYNAAILNSQGIVTAINSDDSEMSRRLNQEAAKSMKYGGVSEEDAWKFVTLNPAKLLHLDKKVGSIKVGKDADVVLWNGHPLSVYTKAEKTIIEGVTYFDLNRDKQMRTEIKKERSNIINMLMQAKNKGLKTQPIKKKEKTQFHCDTE